VIVPLVRFASDPRLGGATIEWRERQLDVLELFGRDDLRVVALAAGRQGGKSTMAVATALWNCVARDDLDALVPTGRTRHVLVASPSEEQSRELIRIAAGMIEASPVLRALAEPSRNAITFRLSSGARTALLALPANPATVRGKTASLTIVDECAHLNSDAAGWNNDTRMIEALEGSMSVFDPASKSKLILISTPAGEVGEFHRIYTAARDGTLPNASAVHAPAWELNPDLDSEAWRESKIRLLGQAGFDQEHGAVFTTGSGQFFDVSELSFALDRPARPEESASWVVALDPGFHSDRFGVAIVGESRFEPGVFLVGGLWSIDPRAQGIARDQRERRAREDRILQLAWELIAPFRSRLWKVVTDQHDSVSVRSFFGNRGAETEVVGVTGPILTEMMVMVRSRLTNGSLRCWPDPELLEDLRRVRARSTSESIVLPRHSGGHCDELAALGLAVRALGGEYHADPLAGMAVGQPGRGWSNGGGPDAPEFGTRSYDELSYAERVALSDRGIGLSGANGACWVVSPRDTGWTSGSDFGA
jgi:Terminase large subunit, T4likevirus-type, N-terminal